MLCLVWVLAPENHKPEGRFCWHRSGGRFLVCVVVLATARLSALPEWRMLQAKAAVVILWLVCSACFLSDWRFRSIPGISSVSTRTNHSGPAKEPWTGAESQSHERTDVRTLKHLKKPNNTNYLVFFLHIYNPVRRFHHSDMTFLLLRFVLNELVQTEKDYVKDLGIVVEVRSFPVCNVRCFLKLSFSGRFWCSYRISWSGLRRRAFLMTWKEKTKSSSETSTRSTTGTESKSPPNPGSEGRSLFLLLAKQPLSLSASSS